MNWTAITQAEYETLRFQIIEAGEGVELEPYVDKKGLPTIGLGANLQVADNFREAARLIELR